jgi:hypothetical protein
LDRIALNYQCSGSNALETLPCCWKKKHRLLDGLVFLFAFAPGYEKLATARLGQYYIIFSETSLAIEQV